MTTAIPITEKQQKVLDFMVTFYLVNDAIPSGKAIADAFGFASQNGAYEHVRRLTKKGYLEKNECGALRFSRNRPHPGWTRIVVERST